MSTCERIRDEAAGIAALRPDDPERAAAEAHASGCPGCALALAEGERLQALLAEAAPATLPGEALGRAYQEIRGELRREARRRLLGAIGALSAAMLVLIAFARARSPSSVDWALAAVLWATAVVLSAAASRRPGLVVVLAVLAVVGVGVVSGRPGPFVPLLGLECVATELGSAALVVGAVWLALRGGTTSPAGTTIAAVAAAGAVAGAAALQVTCAAHGSMPHLLAFHVGGVLLAAAGAGLIWRRRPAPAMA
jgi:hypothetical protein